MGLCASLGRCCGSTKDTPTTTFQPASNRHCTDILFLLLFIASFGGMLAVILTATGRGATPERIYHGVNWKGDVCGSGDFHDQKYNAWVAMPSTGISNANGNDIFADCDDCFYIKTCLNNCSQTLSGYGAPEMIDLYPSTDWGYFCVPDIGAVTNIKGSVDVKIEFAFSGDFDTAAQNAGRAIGDIYTVWPLLLGSAAIALLFSFLYNFLSETFAGVLVFFSIIIIIAGGVLVSYTLIQSGRDARDGDFAIDRANAEYGLGITLAVLTLVFTFVVIAMRNRIRIAVEVVKEASRCVHDIWSLVVFPIVPMVLGLGYIVFWIVVVLYIFAVWDTREEILPPYITQSPQFRDSRSSPPGPYVWNGTANPYEYYTWDTSMQATFAYTFFHLLWSTQFIIYFAYMVMAGTVANWYFAPMDANEKRIVGDNPGELSRMPVTSSCGRTCRFHIGTVALAALIIAIVEFIRACVKYIEEKCAQANGGKLNCLQKSVFCIIHCCLACLQCCLDKINKNALVWTSIWGDSFGTACCSSFKLLWGNIARTGAMSIVSSFLMFLGKVIIALATLGFGALFIHYQYEDISSPVLPLVVIFIIGYIVGSLFMAVFEVAMDTIFLCFLIDEKLHAGSGTMCASKGLRTLVDSDEMRAESKMYAQKAQEQQDRRNKLLNTTSGQQQPQSAAQNQTGVSMAPAPLATA